LKFVAFASGVLEELNLRTLASQLLLSCVTTMGKFEAVNRLMASIPGVLFTRVMDHLFEVGGASEMQESIMRGEVPQAMADLFDQSVATPRLLDNTLLFTRQEAFSFGLAKAPNIASEVVKGATTEDKTSLETMVAVADAVEDLSDKENFVVVTDVSRADRHGDGVTGAYVPPSDGAGITVVEGHATAEAVASLPIPGFQTSATATGLHDSATHLRRCAVYAGGGVVLTAGTFEPLVHAARAVWEGKPNEVPLVVGVFQAHPSGRFLMRSGDPMQSLSEALLDAGGYPAGYFEFVASTLLPRSVVINPDGAPPDTKLRARFDRHWRYMFPESLMYADLPTPNDPFTGGAAIEYRQRLGAGEEGGYHLVPMRERMRGTWW